PDMHMGIYDWAIIFDHQERKTVLIAQHKDPKTKDIISFIENRFMSHKELIQESFQPLDPFKSNMDYSQYNHAFQKIKKHLHSGDCYQINLTQRFSTTLNEHSWSTYQYLRQKNPAPYSAYISLEEGSILSFSPERFLQVRDHQVETKPIKGTRPRSADLDKDKMLKDELQHSEKDKAENLMIVDLLRNDLGKNCIPGSIKVPKLFNIETFTTVHHLVSTITGTLRPNKHSLDLLRDCFPGGSITGTPKIRAMEIIEELEPHRRSVYCGAIGYISFDGDMDTNIAIRTLIQDKDQLHCSAGGAIVADSELQSEYGACLVKIKKITEALTVE
ncbi:MAG: aminodeoxychorismate synthase component I, partial [Proteobacteria bacterium]|nr:aminodeoxychorismate synthase component I [Pseudomonadota bacterium]